MTTNSAILKAVKAMFIAIAVLASVASNQAQGLGLQNVNFGDGSAVNLGSGDVNFDTGGVSFLNGESYGGLPQPPSLSRDYQIIGSAGVPSHFPTPLPDSSSGFQPSVITSSIQPAPEPSSSALLITGLVIGAAILYRGHKERGSRVSS